MSADGLLVGKRLVVTGLVTRDSIAHRVVERAVADAVCFLLSGLALGISGELIHVDGGYPAMGAAVPATQPDPALAGVAGWEEP